MGLPASPPATSEDSEADNDSPPPIRPCASTIQSQQSISVQVPVTQDQSLFNPQLIRIDEYTMQLHFTPLYFGEFDSSHVFSDNDCRCY